MVERFDPNKEIKRKIEDMLFDACLDKNVNDIAKLSRAYNDFCQAQRSQAMSTVELCEKGISYGYAEPTVDRFNNEIKK